MAQSQPVFAYGIFCVPRQKSEAEEASRQPYMGREGHQRLWASDLP